MVQWHDTTRTCIATRRGASQHPVTRSAGKDGANDCFASSLLTSNIQASYAATWWTGCFCRHLRCDSDWTMKKCPLNTKVASFTKQETINASTHGKRSESTSVKQRDCFCGRCMMMHNKPQDVLHLKLFSPIRQTSTMGRLPRSRWAVTAAWATQRQKAREIQTDVRTKANRLSNKANEQHSLGNMPGQSSIIDGVHRARVKHTLNLGTKLSQAMTPPVTRTLLF